MTDPLLITVAPTGAETAKALGFESVESTERLLGDLFGAIAELRGEHRIYQHIELRGACGDHRRAHEQEDGLDPRIAPTEIQVEAIAGACQGGQLHQQLQRATEQRGNGDRRGRRPGNGRSGPLARAPPGRLRRGAIA